MSENKTPFEEKRARALLLAEERCREAWEKCPGLEETDRELSSIGLKIFKTSLLADSERENELERLRILTASLQEKKRSLLKRAGLSEDYTSPKFECKKCSDTGYIGHKMCSCYKAYLANKRARASGLGKYLDSQTFSSFRLDFYPEHGGIRDNMRDTLEQCRKYANEFNAEDGESLLFVGGTGLGKTHLSGAIAQVVLEKGFSVVYDSAQNILSAFERDRFSQSDKKTSDRYYNADLLIIDDLGSEMRGSAAMAYFYTLINTRLVSSKSVIISTNLSPEALRRQYEERFVSRLFGEYTVFPFEGDDIRQIKKARECK